VSTTLTAYSNTCLNAGGIQMRILVKCKMNAAKKSIKGKDQRLLSAFTFLPLLPITFKKRVRKVIIELN
jgi:hypothetical protein